MRRVLCGCYAAGARQVLCGGCCAGAMRRGVSFVVQSSAAAPTPAIARPRSVLRDSDPGNRKARVDTYKS
eukprot:gene11036-biopygen782